MKRVSIAALVMLVVGLQALSVFAQGTTPGAPVGTISVSGSGTSYSPNILIPGFSQQSVFILIDLDFNDIGRPTLNSSTGILAWEAGLTIDPSFNILSAQIRSISINVGTNINLVVGLATPILGINTPTDLVQYTIGYFAGANAPSDVPVTLGPTTPSSFSPAAPGFNDNVDVGECTIIGSGLPTNCLRPFLNVQPAVINCTPGTGSCIVPVDHPSWGAIKANFGD